MCARVDEYWRDVGVPEEELGLSVPTASSILAAPARESRFRWCLARWQPPEPLTHASNSSCASVLDVKTSS